MDRLCDGASKRLRLEKGNLNTGWKRLFVTNSETPMEVHMQAQFVTSFSIDKREELTTNIALMSCVANVSSLFSHLHKGIKCS